MKKNLYVLMLTPLGLVLGGCADEPVVATTEVRQDVVTTTGPVTTREVVVTREPPALRVEARAVSPGPRYVWNAGYWRWSGSDYVWAPGGWVLRPRATAVWVQGHWVRRPGGWVWIAGHWR
jgi:hypothetical protein